MKLVLTGDADIARAREVGVRHGGHLSRNARRALANGRHERFVTQRCYGIGPPEARRRLDAMLADLTGAGFPPAEVEQEFVVVDDNPLLDRGCNRRPMNDPAPRAALDRVLRLVAGAECGKSLVLRGSVAMLARVDAARPPRDLDWIVLASQATPIDDLDPYPYVNQLDWRGTGPRWPMVPAVQRCGRLRISIPVD